LVNYYHILALSTDASQKQIKASFKTFAIKYHPDKNIGNTQAEEKFKLINEAYQTLSDPEKKNIYDQKLSYFLYHQPEKKQAPPPPKFEHSPPPPDFKSGDFSKQGKHYQGPFYDHSKRSSLTYVIAFTIVFMIAVGSLLFGFMMNKIAATEHYKTAVLHFESENYPKAITELNKALEFNAEYGEAYLLRAEIKFLYQKYETALPDFNLAIKYLEETPTAVVQKRDECRRFIQENGKAAL
jgi:curved DNA-binding protein CbpA